MSNKFYNLMKKVVNKYNLNADEENVLTCIAKGMDDQETMKQLYITKSQLFRTKTGLYEKMNSDKSRQFRSYKVLSVVINELIEGE